MEKIEMFRTRLRWKPIHFDTKTRKNDQHKWYGLKTLKRAKQVKELIQFDVDLIGMPKVIKFHKVRNQFLTKLDIDTKQLSNPIKH